MPQDYLKYPTPRTALFVAIFFAFFNTAAAQTEPSALVLELTAKLKNTGSPAPILDYIHWENLFETTPQNLLPPGVKDSEGLKRHYESLYTKPAEHAARSVGEHFAKLRPENDKDIQKLAEAARQKALEREAGARKLLTETKYSIGQVNRDGSKAAVEVIAARGGEEIRDTISLTLFEGRWYLSSPNINLVSHQTGRAASPLP